jgi:NAD(P)-dependent dehydrogenase (short-subunit alcohol dehydrogenase family)
VDVLVNNAGVLAQGRFAAMGAASHQQMIDLNISGLTAMLSAFVPPMVARGTGRVLNVASIASFQPVPSLATYAASKAYVLSLTESLSEELRGSGVSITALCPGITATGMLDQALDANPQVSRIPGFRDRRCDRCGAPGLRRLHEGRGHLRARCREPGGHAGLAQHAEMAAAAHLGPAGAAGSVNLRARARARFLRSPCDAHP